MWKIIKYLLIAILISLALVAAGYLLTPEPQDFKIKNPARTAFMEMRIDAAKAKGQTLFISHRYVKYSRISQDLKDAVRISEDGGFFYHNGFDFGEIKESIKTNIKNRRFKRGGSTITQQLAKNLYLSSKKSVVRKVEEAFLTLKLEKQLSKKRIFNLYLNYIEFGDGVFGVEAACKKYFNKSANKVTIFEAARLASIIPNPRKWSPNNPTKRLRYRTKILLDRMYKFKKISKKEYDKSLRAFGKFFN
ncbi:MAG: monofunctional biosynthetic peptidoglycan transglycosylase [Desulfobacteraceae bacterium]|nr:monofunctional biosynthetic peptidoglycan transglycosylase [Desulfobacteraceae bacterium]